MSKKNRKKNKPHQVKIKPHQAQINAATPEFKLLRNMSAASRYTGAARIIELAPPGIQFRALTNVDHITQISFANKVEEIKVYDEENVDGLKVAEDEEVKFHMETKVVGFQVICAVGGQQNEFTFSKLETAISYYNDLIEQLDAVGIPMSLRERIFAPPTPDELAEEITELRDADGEEIGFEKIDLDPAEELEPEPKPH